VVVPSQLSSVESARVIQGLGVRGIYKVVSDFFDRILFGIQEMDLQLDPELIPNS